MPLTWKAPRSPHTLDELSPAEQAQLGVISGLYFGEARPLAGLLPPIDDTENESDALHDLSLAAIEEDGAHAYDAWSYMGDSGTFFRAGTTEVVGEIIQCGFESHRETEAGEHFAAAYHAHPQR